MRAMLPGRGRRMRTSERRRGREGWLLIAYVDARGEKRNLTGGGGGDDRDGKGICNTRRQICFWFALEPFLRKLHVFVQGLFYANPLGALGHACK